MVRISNPKIIKMLKENARIPYVKIAEKLGVSETAIRKRIKKLEEEKIIKRYTVDIDNVKLGYNVRALIGIDTTPDSYISAVTELKSIDEVISLFMSTGDHMIMIECWFKNSSELAQFIERIREIEGVIKICPAILHEQIK